ncbi:MAG: HDOD domain-containing protein [Gammaproteobacteria bacterium]|nr:HDOD domain-containing protein [Gammaproteobacteria bacterium]
MSENDTKEIDVEDIEHILQGIHIPPQPTILREIQGEQNQPAPNIQKISALINKDISLSAIVLKTINSPFYGMRKPIESVQRAVILLGINNILTIVMGVVIRETLSGKSSISLDRFWQSTTDSANISMFLAKRFSLKNAEDMYTLGLFHDCGMALLTQKFDNYKDILQKANNELERPITDTEDRLLQTNHATIGYYVSKSWTLPRRLANIILDHHNKERMFFDGSEHQTRNQMMALLKLADHLSCTYRQSPVDHEWQRVRKRVFYELELPEIEYNEIKEEIHTLLQQQEAG